MDWDGMDGMATYHTDLLLFLERVKHAHDRPTGHISVSFFLSFSENELPYMLHSFMQ